MLIMTSDSDLFKKETDRMIDAHQHYLNDEIKRKIRSRFDNAIIDTAAKAWIEIAKKYGFTELAAEMEADLNYELNEKASITQKACNSKKHLSF